MAKSPASDVKQDTVKRDLPRERHAPETSPDEVNRCGDALPDDLRRRDQAETPDSLPPTQQDDVTLSPDGGRSDHPIHDEPLDDMQPEDYESAIDDAEKGKLEERVDEETVDPRVTQDFAPGDADPLDQQNKRSLEIEK